MKTVDKEFRKLAQAIERLKKASRELDELDPPETLFGDEVASLRAKLKDPAKADEVERELAALRTRVGAAQSQPVEAAPLDEPEAPLFVMPSEGRAFPEELLELYYDCSFVGSGGFASVFRAKRKSDGMEVAVKVPNQRDAQTGRSFLTEITSWQRLNHRNIGALYDFNVFPIPYLQMELCERSLSDLPLPLNPEEAAGTVFHIAEGLRHAHSKGTIHRDLKPHNILLKGEVPKIVDWGLSKAMAESRSTRTHSFSPYWAAPEQLSPQKFGRPDQRTDIYQLGVVFYELATGELPFRGDSITEIMGQILMETPRPVSSLEACASPLEPIVMKCLEKNMNDRYQTVAELQKDLAAYLRVEYKESLARSRGDMRRSAFYCAELCLVHLSRGDLGEALKYATDLSHYAGEAARNDLANLVSEIEFRSSHEQHVTGEFVERAALVLHQVKVGR